MIDCLSIAGITNMAMKPSASPIFTMRLLIRHPYIDPDDITRKLKLEPDLLWRVNEARTSPAGRPLAGAHKTSMWSKSLVIEDKRSFFDELNELLERLEMNKEFVKKLTDDKGIVTVIFDLHGRINIGDVVTWRTMGRLAALQVNLGVEVFPNFAKA